MSSICLAMTTVSVGVAARTAGAAASIEAAKAASSILRVIDSLRFPVGRLRRSGGAVARACTPPPPRQGATPSLWRHAASIASASTRRPIASECFSRTSACPACDIARHSAGSR